MNLMQLTEVFKKYLKLDDVKLMMLHTALATRLSIQMTGTAVWIIFIGASGDGKSEIVTALDDRANIFMLHEITSNTLVSGFEKRKKIGGKWVSINCDLAPQLNKKLVLIPDMAQILKLHPNEKAKVWAQLRELYDGRASKKTGNMEEQKRYDGLRITLLACSTPAIDSQILIHQDLGTRELLFRTDSPKSCSPSNDGDKTLTQQVWENEGHEEKMRLELNASVRKFFEDKKIQPVEISKEVQTALENYAEVLRHLRASAEIDSYTGELLGVVYPEQPTRVLKQLKRIFISLKSLDPQYPDELALQIIEHIVKSSCSYNRWLVLEELSRQKTAVQVGALAQNLKLGIKTIYRELNTLWNLGLIDRQVQTSTNFGKTYETHTWSYNDDHLNKKIQELFKEKVCVSRSPDNKSTYIFSIRTFFQTKEEKENNNTTSCHVVNGRTQGSPDNKGIKGKSENNDDKTKSQRIAELDSEIERIRREFT